MASRLTKDLQPTCKTLFESMGIERIVERRMPRAPCFRQRPAKLCSGSTAATCTWCWLLTKDGKPVRFKVTLDGAAPGENRGVDTAPDGTGEIREPRMYQLIRQKGPIVDRTFEIEFLDPGVQALDFTFG